MEQRDAIYHPGVVRSVNGNYVKVEIIDNTACTTCEISGSCEVSGFHDKIVDIKTLESFRPGDRVTVIMTEKQGMMASFFGYILPFILVFLVFFLVSRETENELYIGLSGLGILVPYYLILYLLKKHFKNKLAFKVKKQNSKGM